MQSILKRLFTRGQQQPLPNISIMGLDNAGKTTLLYKLAISEVTSIIPTIGLYIKSANIQVPRGVEGCNGKDQRPLLFTARVADAGGCTKIYPLVRLAMMDVGDVSAIIWVVDASSGTDWLDASLEELGVLLHGTTAREARDGNKENFASSIPILILANKIDLLPDRKFPYEFGASITAAPGSSSGLAEAFAWLGDVLTASISSSSPKNETTNNVWESSGTESSENRKKQNATVEDMISNMRAPVILSAKLEGWLSRADNDRDTSSDEELLRRFYALDLLSWDHYIHLRLAYILLLKYGRTEGKDKIFDGFKTYIEKNGKGVHGGKSFHLTMTYFWV
ncbi:P-loop containing nucleoside triphosphate hydrolase protein [Cladorrhinum sp. PSN259]|nr:P-loop containing nucleoside triphosphate hydrolase protein [Cladorrhinum sp. PSN259]